MKILSVLVAISILPMMGMNDSLNMSIKSHNQMQINDIPTGNKNLGNSCYANAFLTALCRPRIAQLLLENKLKFKGDSLGVAICNYVDAVWNGNTAREKYQEELIGVIVEKLQLERGQQEDSVEVATFVFDYLSRFFPQSFTTQHKETSSCSVCKGLTLENKVNLPALTLKPCGTFEGSLIDYIARLADVPEQTLGCFNCCKETKHELSSAIECYPEILLCGVARFLERKKNKSSLSFPFDYCFDNQMYSLAHVIFHSGESPLSGHYFSCVNANNNWYLINDSYVTPIQQTAMQEIARKGIYQSYGDIVSLLYIRNAKNIQNTSLKLLNTLQPVKQQITSTIQTTTSVLTTSLPLTKKESFLLTDVNKEQQLVEDQCMALIEQHYEQIIVNNYVKDNILAQEINCKELLRFLDGESESSCTIS